jgi:hypothetical protein
MTEPSPLPPKRRDTTGIEDRVRQDRINLKQLGVGFVGGRFPPARPLGATALYGDLEDDDPDIELAFINTDRSIASGSGNAALHLTYLPEDGSEHVSWHPNGGGGLHLTPADWYRVDQVITIPAFDGLASGDVFTCEYAYLLGEEPETPTPSLVGFTQPGVWSSGPNTISYDLPPGTASGDLIVISSRGLVAPGGGELVLDVGCSDSRMALVHKSTRLNGSGQTIVEAVFAGLEDGSGSPVVVTNTARPGYSSTTVAVLAAFTGVNGFGVVSGTDAGVATPIVDAVAAVAATWLSGPVATNAGGPTGYTDISSTGIDYASTCLSWWYDPDADPDTSTSPAGTFLGEGCCVIAIT